MKKKSLKFLKNKVAKIEFRIEKLRNLILKRTELKRWKSNAIFDLEDKLNQNLLLAEQNIITRKWTCNEWNHYDLVMNNID